MRDAFAHRRQHVLADAGIPDWMAEEDETHATFQEERLPDWTAAALCRDKVTIEGEAWEAAFTDDLTYKTEGDYRWPASLLEVMAVCARCPVRRECLTYAHRFEETSFKIGARGTTDEEYELTGQSFVHEYLKPMPVGVYGGIPGPMRERFKDLPNWLEVSEAWFATLSADRGWLQTPTEEVA